MKVIEITTEAIKLQDLLKVASLAATGGAAKIAVELGEVTVNNRICTQRGKKIRPGDVVIYHGHELTVAYADQ